MLPYKNLIIVDKHDKTPVYRQISLQFIDLIQDGKLLPGTKLPSTRALAEDLQLHRKTIVAVYEILVSENWLDNLPRKGFQVSETLPVVRPRTYQKTISPFAGIGSFEFDNRDVIQFPLIPESTKNLIINDGFPDTTLLPYKILTREFRRALDRVTTINDLHYIADKPNLKSSLRDFLHTTRGIDFGIENLFITRGAQMAVYLAASLILKPGDKVVMSEPSYIIADAMFEKLGVQIIRVPIDQHGMRTEVLEDVLKEHDIKLIYMIPHHHHPTTVTMSTQRRSHMLELIKTYKSAVIEDDYDYDFQFKYDNYLPLASGDHGGNVIYVGSLTKVLGTPFRLGYMIATQEFLAAVMKLRLVIDIRGDLVTERAVAALIDNGDLIRHIQKSNKVYAKRCTILCRLLDKEMKQYLTYRKPTGGMAVWVVFKPQFELSKIARYAKENGLSIKSDFYFNGKYSHYNAFRFGFASLDEAKLKRAVAILKQAVEHFYPSDEI
ncbi:PLP-dependent aminotransferase family protein [Sphingobacterium kitahiroshimense]|uniref:PLP-dependent aminotransferase family protein n=1 Tax=Sphingobacterium kitahiroshimense TaxID=470446 RepID=A0ABV0BWN0_9SPHI